MVDAPLQRRRHVLLGVGNPDRGDDAAGRAVARHLRGALPSSVDIIEHEGEAMALFAEIDNAAAVFAADACASGAPPGAIHRFDVNSTPLPEGTFGVSTHGFGLATAIELVRAIGRLPPRFVVYGIEGSSFEPGAALSPPVQAAVAEVARRLSAEIADAEGEDSSVDRDNGARL